MVSLKKIGRRFLNSKGFSLMELMVSMGVSMIIALIASFAFSMAFDVYIRMIRQYDAEVEMSSLMYALRSSMATAVHVEYGGRSNIINHADTNTGFVDERVGLGQLYTITDVAVPPSGTSYAGGERIVAMFNREIASFSSGQSNLQAVQIVYQRPDVVTGRSGVIYIDTERNTTVGGGWVRVRPVNAPQMYTRLTNFQVDNVKVYDSNGAMVNVTAAGGEVCVAAPGNCTRRPVASAEIQMVMRYFTRGREQDWKWCNNARASLYPACLMSNVNFYDVERKMTVVFANNAYERLEYLPRRPFGNVYFLNPWRPLRKF